MTNTLTRATTQMLAGVPTAPLVSNAAVGGSVASVGDLAVGAVGWGVGKETAAVGVFALVGAADGATVGAAVVGLDGVDAPSVVAIRGFKSPASSRDFAKAPPALSS